MSRIFGLTGLRPTGRFAGPDLEKLVVDAGFTLATTRWIDGLLPVRYVSASKASLA